MLQGNVADWFCIDASSPDNTCNVEKDATVDVPTTISFVLLMIPK